MTTHTLVRRFSALAALFALTLAALAQAPATKNFNVPAGSVTNAIKAFSGQSGVEVLMPTDAVKGVRTNAVQGAMSPREALEKMVAGTNLTVIQDEKTGALGLRADPASPKNADSRLADTIPTAKIEKSETGAVKLETYTVLGSRIRQADAQGPSPVNTYDRDAIRASGALSLADFLRTLPQTYGGVGVGRTSAPNDLNMAGGARNESAFLPFTPPIGASPILGNAAPIQTGVSGVSLRGLGSGSTLVLVDGRRVAQAGSGNRGSATGQGFVDINTIPLGLIDHIEVITDGASAVYGADAVAGVINVVLKKEWVGAEISGGTKITEHGGGQERQATVTSGFVTLGGRLNVTLALDYYERLPLMASQRSFTASMDHRTKIQGYAADGTPVFGTDQRIQWGYPASIQSTATTGFVSIPGTRVLLAPEGSATTPPISAFIPRSTNASTQSPTLTAIVAQGQRVTNPAPWLQLIAGAERTGLMGTAKYSFRNGIEAYGNYSFSDSRSDARSLPAYVANVAVSAANNPFGENIQFGMFLADWGSVWQTTRTQTHTFTAGLRGKFRDTWRWDVGYREQDQDFEQKNRSFNQTAFNFFANNADPAQRFNPFIDERVAGAPSQKSILDQTAIYPRVSGRSGLESFDLSADGELFGLWGGPVKMALGGSYESTDNTNAAVNYAGFPVTPTVTTFTDHRNARAIFGELSVPLFGKPNAKTLLRRLDVRFSGRRDSYSDAGSSQVPQMSVAWAPFSWVLFRGNYSEGFRAPSLTEDRRVTANFTINITDPSRGNQVYSVAQVARSNPDLKPESSTTKFYGVTFEPPFVKGLTLQANYYQTVQKDAIQGSIATTTYLNNEALFAGFIVRNAPSAADTAAGFKGLVTTVFFQPVNFGLIVNESVDFMADYHLPREIMGGHVRLGVNTAHTLKQTRQLTFGGVPIDDTGDTFSSPDWNILSTLRWNRGPLTMTATHSYMSGYLKNNASTVPSNFSTPPVRMVDLRSTYEFKNGLWRNYGKGLIVGVGVSNLFDKEPPFFNGLYGFNAGLHGKYVFGRTYELSFLLPL